MGYGLNNNSELVVYNIYANNKTKRARRKWAETARVEWGRAVSKDIRYHIPGQLYPANVFCNFLDEGLVCQGGGGREGGNVLLGGIVRAGEIEAMRMMKQYCKLRRQIRYYGGQGWNEENKKTFNRRKRRLNGLLERIIRQLKRKLHFTY